MRHPTLILAMLMTLLAPALSDARIYIWTDADGVKHYSQEPPPGDATDVVEQEEVGYDPSADAKSHRTGGGASPAAQPEGETRIVMEGNIIFIPATLAYGGQKVDTMLVLDTGASSTVLSAPMADRLGIPVEINTQVKVAGGEKLDAQSVNLDSLTVGPHTRQNMRVLVLRHQGAKAKLSGGLGLNFLRHYPYTIDMQKMVIKWDTAAPAGTP